MKTSPDSKLESGDVYFSHIKEKVSFQTKVAFPE